MCMSILSFIQLITINNIAHRLHALNRLHAYIETHFLWKIYEQLQYGMFSNKVLTGNLTISCSLNLFIEK